MPSLDIYRHLMSGSKNGVIHKNQSDMVLENTWWNDINAQVAYIYDIYHDDEPLKLSNLSPAKSKTKVPIDIKYLTASTQTFNKDPITYRIQLRPSQECNVDYYEKSFGIYDAVFPVGLYIDIADNRGVYNRWLIVDKANYNDPQWGTYEVLRCDKILQYIYNGKRYQMPMVLRSQNSYNSGVWLGYKIEEPEDQQIFIIPLNRDTEHIYYNLRIIIDNNVLTEPRAWRVTKVNRISHNGLAQITLAQDRFDQHKDYVELDSDGNVIGMWADYWESTVEPTDVVTPTTSVYGEITHSGLNAELKVGGSYKKFTISFYDQDKNPIDFKSGVWAFAIGDEDASDLVSVLTNEDTSDCDENQIKVKFLGDDSWLRSILTISYITDDDVKTSIEVEIDSL